VQNPASLKPQALREKPDQKDFIISTETWRENNMRRVKIVSLILYVLWALTSQAQNSISAVQAKEHVGEKATVCGEVVSTHYAASSRGGPTFINLDKPYPNQIFTVVIWGSDRPKFGDPESMYRSKRVCVSGTIESYRGVPQIVAREPGQIRAQ
jgi:DNA/RNA endonuclease YhcR with UshA esterase domain